MQNRRAEVWVNVRTIVIIALAVAVAQTCYWFYHESGGTGFFLPMLVLHAVCISTVMLINRRYNTNQTTATS